MYQTLVINHLFSDALFSVILAYEKKVMVKIKMAFRKGGGVIRSLVLDACIYIFKSKAFSYDRHFPLFPLEVSREVNLCISFIIQLQFTFYVK